MTWFNLISAANSTFLLWHFVALILSVTGLLIEKSLPARHSAVRSVLLRTTLLLAFAVPVVGTSWSWWLIQPSAKADPLPISVSSTAVVMETRNVDWDHVAVWRPLISDVQKLPRVLPAFYGDFSWLRTIAISFLPASVLVSVVLLIRFARSLVICRAWRREGKRVSPEEKMKCAAVASALGIRQPQLLRVQKLKSPMLIGFFKPAILLPAELAIGDEIYSHELTHLRRHDMGWHLLSVWATIAMPFQPGFWLLKNALERADEDVSDDAVLGRGADAVRYANLLVEVAESQSIPGPELCLPMAALRSQLERRLRRLLNARPVTRRSSLSFLCFGLGPLLAISLVTGAIFIDTERSNAASDKTAPSLNVSQAESIRGTDTPLIQSIDVEFIGGASVPRAALTARIIAASGFQLGTPCEVGQLHRATKQIYATGEVATLEVKAVPLRNKNDVTGIAIDVVVQPNPVVKRIHFVGVDAAEGARLASLLRTKEGRMTSEDQVFEDAQHLSAELAKEGIPLAATETTTTHLDPALNTADVTFTLAHP